MARTISEQERRIRIRYGVESRRALLAAIRDDFAAETGERYTLRDADLLLDGMLEAEYQRIESGAYDPAPVEPSTDPAETYERGLARLDPDAAYERYLEDRGEIESAWS